MSYEKKENGNVNKGTVSTVVLNMLSPAYVKICYKCNKKIHFANVCKTKAKLSVKSMDAVCNDTEHSEIDKLFSLTLIYPIELQ